MSCTCFALISPERAGGAKTPRGCVARTCARARAASCRHAASLRSSAEATSRNEKSNTSCSRKAARSSGDSLSSVKSSAMDKSSASSVRLSGASAAVSTTGSGSHGPTYSSCRARAEVSTSRQIRVVVVIRNALGSDTLSRTAPCQRRYVSCTASSASAIDPSMRYARPSSRLRYGSKLAAGFDIALVELTSRAPALTRCGGSGPEPSRRVPPRSAPTPRPRRHRLLRCRCRAHRWQWPKRASR